MGFCSNCGQPIADGAKFCPNCGIPVSRSEDGIYKVREKAYAGKMIKCPACGEDIPSLTAICPSCGHEFNSVKISASLKAFIERLDECEQAIAEEEAHCAANDELSATRGWRSWSITAKVLWIALNCLTLCAPILIYHLSRSRFFHKAVPSAKRKVNLIENFQIPTERQAIIESLYFIRDKVSALALQKTTADILYWSKLWNVKSNQIYKKAQSSIPDDITISELYHEITSSVQQIRTAAKRKNRLSVVIAVVYIIAVAAVETLTINAITRTIDIPNALRFLSGIWALCAILLITFFVWIVKKIPTSVKGVITIALCIVILAFSMQSCKENVSDFTTQISSTCNDNNMTLSNVDMNELTKVVSIDVQTSAYDSATIDKAESDFFAVARECKFDLTIHFIDADDLEIRVSRIDEYGAIKHLADNTNGVLSFVKSKCTEYGAELDEISNSYDDSLEFQIKIAVADNNAAMDKLQDEIFATKTQFGYSGYKINFYRMDKYSNELLRAAELEPDNSISLVEYMTTFDLVEVNEFISNAAAMCRDRKTSMVVTVRGEYGEFFWKSFIDADGNQVEINVHEFTIEAQKICEADGAIIDGVSVQNTEISFDVYVNSRRRDTIDRIEASLINAYQTYSDLREISITFWDEDYPSEVDKVYDMDLDSSEHFDRLEELENKHKIRDIEVDSSGVISHLIDNTD